MVKLARIKNIIYSLYNINVELVLTTSLDNMILAVTDNKKFIIVNGNYLKSNDEIIKAVAHELVHFKDGIMNDEDVRFNDLTNKYITEINKKFGGN